MSPRLKSVTFIELLIAIMLLSVIILAINGMDIFSRNQIVSSNQRTRIQNNVSRCLEHIAKNASNTVGNEATYGADTAVYIRPDFNNTTTLAFFTDIKGNGARDVSNDYWVGYNLNTTSHNFNYCNNCANATCVSCSGTVEVLAQDITAFSAAKNFTNGNYVNITMTGCWDPTRTCGAFDNPSVNLTTSIALPSLSTN